MNLPHEITIQKSKSERSTYGNVKNTWETFATVAAKVSPLSGKNYMAAKQMVTEITHDIKIWTGLSLTNDMRIIFRNSILEIINIINKDEQWTYIKCREVFPNE